MSSNICSVCSSKMVKNGKTKAGTQRYRCLKCGSSQSRRYSLQARELKLFLDWLLGKQLQRDMRGEGRSFRRKTAKKWDELVKGRVFTAVDIPALTMLVQWYAVLERCITDISEADGMIAYENKMGDYKTLPQIGVMKQASAEIRTLNKQLGIADGKDVATTTTQGKLSSILKLVQTRRFWRRMVLYMRQKRQQARIKGTITHTVAARL